MIPNNEKCAIYIVEEVKTEGDNWGVCFDGGWWIHFEDNGIKPEVGMELCLIPGECGRPNRGLFLDGQEVYYRTEAEEDERHRKWCEEQEREREEEFMKNKDVMDAKVAALPQVFQDRIQKFRNTNPNFRRDYETYEVFCCEEAVLIANTLKTPEKVDDFYKASWDEKKKVVPDLDDGHSGNTFGTACLLAKFWLENEELVKKAHGALSPLVGCKDYGCPHEE